MDKTLKHRVAIYARVSTHEQTADNQVLDLEGFCKARGWTIKERFLDEGISGAQDDRPRLNQMMKMMRRHQFDALLVWKLDRFARSTKHLVMTLDELRGLKIDFVSYQENIDTSTSQGRLIFHIMSGFAEFERELIRDRVNSGLRRAKAQGKILGRPGLAKSKVDEILALRGKGSIREIAALVGVGRSVVHKVLSLKPSQIVASAIDETSVAF